MPEIGPGEWGSPGSARGRGRAAPRAPGPQLPAFTGSLGGSQERVAWGDVEISQVSHSRDSPQVPAVVVQEGGTGPVRGEGWAGPGGQAVTPSLSPQMSLPCSSEGTCFSQSGASSR